MPNMSYCRFQNTLGDLNDCVESIQNQDVLGAEEAEAARDMASACEEFLQAYKENGLNEEEEIDEDEDEDEDGE